MVIGDHWMPNVYFFFREDLNTVYLLHDRELYAVRFSWDPEVYYKTRQPLKSINGSAAKEIEEVLFGENVSDVLVSKNL